MSGLMVAMLNVLEHVQDPVFVLQKAASLLKDDGVVVVHVPNALAVNEGYPFLWELWKAARSCRSRYSCCRHRRSYTMETLIEDVEKSAWGAEDRWDIYKMLSTPQMDWLLKGGPWEEGGFGWGRVGAEKSKDWRAAFCNACYEIGKENPHDCNVISVTISKY